MDKKKILVIGSLNMDYVISTNRFPLSGETVKGSGFKLVPGGKGANQAYSCGRLGADTAMLGCVGKDAEGDVLIKSLNGAGVDTSGIGRLDGAPTGRAFITVDAEGSNNIIIISGANGMCSVDYLKANMKYIENSDIIVIQLEIPHETVLHIVETAKMLHKTIILNPAPAPEGPFAHLLNGVDILTPNETELCSMTGIQTQNVDDIRRAALGLVKQGVKNVICTWGENGAVWVTETECRHFTTKKVTAVDTTAAGDSFTGAIAVALAEGKGIPEAAEFANRVASIVVTKEGAQPSIPTRDEAECGNFPYSV